MSHLDEGTLQAWLDGERGGLAPGERAEVERHLASCDTCARAARELEALSARALALLMEEAPPTAGAPGYRDVEARARRHRAAGQRGRVWKVAAWAASVGVALGVGWGANEMYRARPFEIAEDEPASASVGAPEVRPAESAAAGPRPGAAERIAAAAPEPSATPTQGGAPARDAVPGSPPPPAPTVAQAPGQTEAGARAPTRAVVRGRVTDPNGRPLPSAQVFVQGTGSGALTSEDGTFSISLDGLPSDSARRLTLRAEIIGFRGDSRPLDVRGGDVASAEFRLEEEALALDEIVVTGSGPRSGGRNPPAPPSEIVLPRAGDLGGWTETDRQEAEARGGFRLLTVPGRPVARIEVRETPGQPALVRIVQELEGGIVLELYETAAPLGFEESGGGEAWTRASIRRDDVSVSARARVSAEALADLVGRLR